MTVLVDTSILIDHLRGRPEATDALAGAFADGQRVIASTVTKIEVLAGMRAAEKRPTLRLLDTLEWIAVDDEVAQRAGLLAREHCRSHPGVGVADYAIAATVLLQDAELWTGNVRHFPMFEGLRPPY